MRILAEDVLSRERESLKAAAIGEDTGPFIDPKRHCVVAVLVPQSGVTGMYGLSCMASAQLAVAEINNCGGVNGQPLSAVFLDADPAMMPELGRALHSFLRFDLISGIVTMSTSEVRQYVNRIARGRVPHVFTSTYDGQEYAPNVFTISSTPNQQLVPAVRMLSERKRVRRWALVGKNYVRPHLASSILRHAIAASGGQIVFERYAPPNQMGDEEALIDDLTRSNPDIVFVSLVAQDAVNFHRAFGEKGLHQKIVRFTELGEELLLLSCGFGNTENMFAAGPFFASLDADIHLAFGERYSSMHGDIAPAINVHGQSLYEGLQFFAAMSRMQARGLSGPVMYPTARGGVFHNNWSKEDPIYLAEADGLSFKVVDELPGFAANR